MDKLKDLLTAGQTRAARDEAQKRLAKNPEDVPALIALAKAHLVEGELAQAEPLLDKAEKKGGVTPDILVCRATLAGEKGQVDQARSLFEQATRAQPPLAEAFHGLGVMLAEQGNYQASLECFQRAVELAPRAGILHYHLARNLMELDRLDTAVLHLTDAIKYNPMYPPAYRTFARMLTALNRLEDARNVLQEGLKVMPNEPSLLNELTNIDLLGGDVGGSFQAAAKLAQSQPNDPAAQANLALLLQAQGRHEEALQICNRMAAKGLSTAALKMIEATALEARKPPDWDGAMRAYESAMGLDHDDWAPANNLGQLLLRRNDGNGKQYVSRAITVLEESLRRSPGRLEPMLNLAIAYARDGQNNRAKELAKQLLKYELPEKHPIRDEAQRLVKTLGG